MLRIGSTRAGLLACAAWVMVVPGAAKATTTVIAYRYNVDGALTAITTQVNDQAPTTTYLTWDDFTPDATTPSTGTVSVGNGRLVGFGASPGTSALSARFTFDPRDRLFSYSGAAGYETYDYHASGLMMSSSVGGDDLRFYFDAAPDAGVTNIHQDSTGLTSAYLGNNRFLDDGTEQILLQPRKDMACTYDAARQTLQSYAYDAFGAAPESDKPKGIYDLRDNPFRYAGEYRDPIWGGYYLRARWYDPDLPVFLSRDPARHLNRYAYGNGNPVMNSDPSGLGPGSLRGFLATLNRGIGGHFARIFLAPLIGPLQIAAYPKQFWDAVKHDRGGIDVFLALGIVSEAVGGYADAALAGFTRLGLRYWSRFASDTILGVGGSVTAGATSGPGRFNFNAFVQGLEYSVNPFLMRGFGGFNVRTGFQLGGADVADLFEGLRNAPDKTALIFRERLATGGFGNPSARLEGLTGGLVGANAGIDKPFLQAAHWSIYHERLIAITKKGILYNEAFKPGLSVTRTNFSQWGLGFDDIKLRLGRSFRFSKVELVGSVENFGSETGVSAAASRFLRNPYNVPVEVNQTAFHLGVRSSAPANNKFGLFSNNCQYHAYAVLKDMGLR